MWQLSQGNTGFRYLVLLFLLLAQAAFIALFNTMSSSDLFLAFAAGSKILQLGPASPDTWSFTVSGKVWVDQSWLSHLILAVFLRSVGPAGPVALKGLLLIGCLVLLFFKCRKLGVSSGIALFTLFLGTMAAGPFLAIRAENFGIFYFLLFLVALSEAAQNKSVRRLGLPLVFLIWCNSHGSFMLGLVLLAAKVGILFFRNLARRTDLFGEPSSRKTTTEWTLVFLACVTVTAVANPYGTENLLMPFRQLGAGLVVSHSADWLPLLDARRVGSLVGAGSVHGYLFFMLVVLCAGFLVLVTRKRPVVEDEPSVSARKIIAGQESGHDVSGALEGPYDTEGEQTVRSAQFRTDWVMEGIILLITTLLAFRFRRFVLFASFALVPVASVVFSLAADRLLTRWGSPTRARRLRIAVSTGVLLVCISMTWLVYRVALLPYHPENPLRPGSRNLMRDLMSYDTFSQSLAPFLLANQIGGNILAGWEISSFLLHELPDVKVFVDTRDQSFYPERVIKDFFTIMGVLENPAVSRVSLLDKYGVTTVVMSTYPYDFNLAKDLVRSRQWGCIYRDDHSVVLVRRDSSRFKEMLANADFKDLWYPDQATRVRSEAFQSLLASGEIREELTQELKAAVSTRPFPDLYGLIVIGLNGSENCFKPVTSKYLLSEVARLSAKSPLYRNGAEEVTGSLMAILGMLETNAQQCGSIEDYSKFLRMKRSVQQARAELEKYYKGRPF